MRCLLLVMCTHPFVKKAFTLHLARSEGHEFYFGCNLMHRKILASSHQHLMAEAPTEIASCAPRHVIVAAAFLAMTHCKPPAGAVAPVFDLSRVIAESSFNIGTLESSQTLDCDFLRFFSFSTTALGDIEAVIDWNRDSNRLDAVIYRGQCNCRLSQRNACEDVVASSIGEPPAKPTRITAEEEPADSYTLEISNLQDDGRPDSGSYQVISRTES